MSLFMQTPWMFNTWVHTRILKKSRYMGTYNNFEKIQDTLDVLAIEMTKKSKTQSSKSPIH